MAEKYRFQNQIIINQKLVIPMENRDNTLLYALVVKKKKEPVVPLEFLCIVPNTNALI